MSECEAQLQAAALGGTDDHEHDYDYFPAEDGRQLRECIFCRKVEEIGPAQEPPQPLRSVAER